MVTLEEIPLIVPDVAREKVEPVWRQGVNENSKNFLLNFAINLNLL